MGVKNQRHAIVEELAEYLLIELALKLFLVKGEPYDVEFGLGTDMEIWRGIASGKFAEFAALTLLPEFMSVEVPSVEPGCLELENVSFRYGGSSTRGSRTAGSGFTGLCLRAQGVSALLGPSGAFKTTLLKIIAGHEVPSAGRVLVDGEDVTRLPSERRRVATVFQDYALFPHLSGLGNVLEGGRLLPGYSGEERIWLARMYLRRLNVSHCSDRLPRSMSGGEQQRVSIARALMADPKILLLDEPTAAIDTLQREGLVTIIKHLAETHPHLVTLIVSHDREFVLGVAEHLTVIDHGSILATGSRSELLNQPPNRRTSEILGTHSVVEGTLNQEGFLVAGQNGTSVSLPVANPPRDLIGTRCFALVRHDGVKLRSTAAGSGEGPSVTRGAVSDVVDHGAVVRGTVRISKGCELVFVSMKTHDSNELRKGALVELMIRPEAVLVVPD
jgi:ABC-type Fe3+/spermidine/putrescine transport system ATPase subunit